MESFSGSWYLIISVWYYSPFKQTQWPIYCLQGGTIEIYTGSVENVSKIHFLKIDFISFISTSSSPNVPRPLKFSKQNSARISHIPCPYLPRLPIVLKILLKDTNYEEGLQFSQAFSCAAVPYKLPAAWYIARDLPFLFQSAFYYLLCLVPLHATAEANSHPVFYSSHPTSVSIHLLPKNELEETARSPCDHFVDQSLEKQSGFCKK